MRKKLNRIKLRDDFSGCSRYSQTCGVASLHTLIRLETMFVNMAEIEHRLRTKSCPKYHIDRSEISRNTKVL